MWPWRRTVRQEPADPPPIVAPRRAWADLPPLQRAVGDHPLVDPPGRFARDLASWQSPAFLAPLGHVVTPGGPSGRVDDIAVARSAEVAPPLPVVRRPRPGRGAVARVSAAVQRWVTDAPDEQRGPVAEGAEPGPRTVPDAEIARPGPEVDPPGPEVGSPGPEVEQSDPEVEQSGPEVEQSGPAAAVPDAGPRMAATNGNTAPAPTTVRRTVDSTDAPAQPAPGGILSAPPQPVLPTSPRPTVSRPTSPQPVTHPDQPYRTVQRTPLGDTTPPRRLGLGAPIVPAPAAQVGIGETPSPATAPAVRRPASVQRVEAEPPAPTAVTSTPYSSATAGPATAGDLPGEPIAPADPAPGPDSPTPDAVPVAPTLGAGLSPDAAGPAPAGPAGGNRVPLPHAAPLTVSRTTRQPRPRGVHGRPVDLAPGPAPGPTDAPVARTDPIPSGISPGPPPLTVSRTTQQPTPAPGQEPTVDPADAAPDLVAPTLGGDPPGAPDPPSAADPPTDRTGSAPAHGNPASLPLTVSRTTQQRSPTAAPREPSPARTAGVADVAPASLHLAALSWPVREPGSPAGPSIRPGTPDMAVAGDPAPMPVAARSTEEPALVVARLLAERPLPRYSLGRPAGNGDGATVPVPAEPAALQRFGVPASDDLMRRASVAAPPLEPAAPVPAMPAMPAPPALPTAQRPPPLAAPPDAPDPVLPDSRSEGWTSVDVTAGGLPDPRPAPGGTASPATAGGATSVPPSPGPAATEPEELLKSLFDPLYRRLRAELRKDRDRRGLITDLRR